MRGSPGHARLAAARPGPATGTPGTRATCPGAPRAPRRGPSWSARSCCSRPRWPGWSRSTGPGWSAGRPRPTWLPSRPGEAVRAWGRLGYPRRALRLHAAATEVVARHGGELPTTYDGLLALPGVGEYTAAAVASFAYGGRHAVLDTNVRRVLARAGRRRARSRRPRSTAAERRRAEACCPTTPATAARWAVAVMELGALVCTARRPAAPAARSPTGARGGWRAARRTTGRGGAPRPSPAPTGRCAGC